MHKYRTRLHLCALSACAIAVAVIIAVTIAHGCVNIPLLSMDSNPLSPRYFLIAVLLFRFVIACTRAPLAEYTIAVIARQMYAGLARLHSAQAASPGFSCIFSAISRYRAGLPLSS